MLKAAVRLAAFAVLAGFALAQPALADSGADISTPAWTNHALPLYVGPGQDYEVRAVLAGGVRVHVARCSRLWCDVSSGRHHGYAFLYSLSFGHGPNSIWGPQELRHPGVRAWPWPWGL
jgi:uncharacterized protein YraI